MPQTPNLFLIGGMRCGSTTLYLLLSQHPEIFMAAHKEPMFWFAEAIRRQNQDPTGRVAGKFLHQEAYQSLFDAAGSERWRGEASHYMYHKDVAQLLDTELSDLRILVSLRDPTQRLYSEYLNRRRGGFFDGSFEAFVTQDATLGSDGVLRDISRRSRLTKGRQAHLLAPWCDRFQADRLRWFFFEDFQARPAQVAQDMYRWLGVDDTFQPQVVHTQRGGVPRNQAVMKLLNIRKAGPLKRLRNAMPRIWRERLRAAIYARNLSRDTMDPAIERALKLYYQDDIERLETMTGRDLTAWKVDASAPGQ